MIEFADTLKTLAEKYEKNSFLNGDPSWFMHQVEGDVNKELMAFIASTLSYGSRKQFMPKIQYILDCSKGDLLSWLTSGKFKEDIPDTCECYYRLYTFSTMHNMLCALRDLLSDHGSIKNYTGTCTGIEAIEKIITWFSQRNISGIIPKDTQSCCKRICMFLRWMVRDNSPVDLGIWSDIIDRRTLIIPLDTHVIQEANRIGLINTRNTSMRTAIKLTEKLKEIFPNDPLKGDFALFGIGIDDSQ
jgi:uncharacterized protein (TIGR02757 family)